MLKISSKYAVICGLFLCITFVVSNYFGVNPLMSLVHLVFDLIMFGLFIFFGMKEFKTDQEDEILHFWQGMTIGFNVYFISTVIFVVFLCVYFAVDPDLLVAYQRDAMAFLLERKDIYLEQMGEDTFAAQVKSIEDATVRDLVISSGLKKILAGFFITPLISIILRKQPK